jgi:hypothetical protein
MAGACLRGERAALVGGDEVAGEFKERFGMGTPLKALECVPPWAELRLYVEPGPETKAVYWRINGFRARLLIWTVAEWEKLEPRPADAQYHPSGVWCALRLE